MVALVWLVLIILECELGKHNITVRSVNCEIV